MRDTVGRDALMRAYQKNAAHLRELLLRKLKGFQMDGLLRSEVNPVVEDNALLGLVNGASLESLIQDNPLSPDQQEEIIRQYVNDLRSNQRKSIRGKIMDITRILKNDGDRVVVSII